MKHEFSPFALTFLCALSAGCGGNTDSGDSGAGSSSGGSSSGGTSATGGTSGSTAGGSGGNPACPTMITANPANNYSFSSTLTFPPIGVQPDTELTFGWGDVTVDFLGHPLDPMGGIDTVNLMLWNLTQEDLETKLNADDLLMRDLGVIATLYTENMLTEGALFDFTSVGMPITPEMILPYVNAENYPPDVNSYTVMIASGDVLGEGTRMIQGFKLDPTSTTTHIELSNTSTHLEYMVNLQAHTRTNVPMGTAAVTIDWGDMTTNALGNAFIPTEITEALVAYYTEPVADLEAQFLDLDLIAEGMWRAEIVSGTTVTLSNLMNESGQAFTGIDGNGTWIVALICGSCRNPAPWYLSILAPCTP
jgi:hypothetical protein